MKTIVVLLVSLITFTASAQVRSAAHAVRKQILSPRTMVYPTVRAAQNYPRFTYSTYSTVAAQRQLSTSQIRVAPVVSASNMSMSLPEKTKFQEIIPVETSKPATLLEDYKVNTSEPKNGFNWTLVIFVSGAVFLICWGILAIYRKIRSDEKNHGEPAGYSKAVISNDSPYGIVLANGGGVLVRI